MHLFIALFSRRRHWKRPYLDEIFKFVLIFSSTVSLTYVETVSAADYELLDVELETLLSFEVTPAADASAKGLSPAFAGGQIGQGAREGIFGTAEFKNSPFAITSFTNQAIRNFNAENIGEILQYSPFVRITRGFGNFQQAYWLRGLPVFSDDMSYNGLFGILPRQLLSTQFIERVEILSGINSFISGHPVASVGTQGGIINVLPKRAPNIPQARFTIGSNMSRQKVLSFDVAKRPFKEFGIRLNGLQDKGDTNINFEHISAEMLSVGTDFYLENYRISAEIGYQDFTLKASPPSINVESNIPVPQAPNSKNNFAQPWTFSMENDIFGTLRTEIELAPGTIAWLAGGARKSNESNNLTAYGSIFDESGNFNMLMYKNTRQDLVFSEDIGIKHSIIQNDMEHTFILNANHFSREIENAYVAFEFIENNIYQPYTSPQPTEIQFSGGSLDNPVPGLETRAISAALGHRMKAINGKFETTIGVRWNQLVESMFDLDTQNLATSLRLHATTPLIAGIYHLNDKFTLYSNISGGIEKPNITEDMYRVYLFNSIIPGFNKAIQKEAGVKWSNASTAASLSLFDITLKSRNYDDENRFQSYTYNSRSGIEFNFFGEPKPHMRFISGASFFNTNQDGYNAIGIPEFQANINIEIDIPFYPALTLTGQYIHTGSVNVDSENSQKLPSWNRVDLGARLDIPLQSGTSKIILKTHIANIFNSNYWASAGGYPGASYLTLSEPRSVWIKTAIEF